MSDQRSLWDDGVSGPLQRPPDQQLRASIDREMRYLLTISNDAGGKGKPSPAGIVHSLGVCMIEVWNMARGKDAAKDAGKGNSLPTFVDIRMDADQRKQFLAWDDGDLDCVQVLTTLSDTGYRVGVAWSGETQSYTVSLTCRSSEQPNNGLCMTSFAKTLRKAIVLAWYKHHVLANGAWRTYSPEEGEGWG